MLLKQVNMTPTEAKRLLKNVNPLSIWGKAIHLVIKHASSEQMDQLIIDLRSQANDNPQMMREILGAVIYNKLGF